MEVQIQTNIDQVLKDLYEKHTKKLERDVKGIMKGAATAMAETAARESPPLVGKESFPNGMYLRPFVVLKKLFNGEYPGMTPELEDSAQFKRGMKFKVLYTKHERNKKKAPAYAYCRTPSELAKLRRITNRGLAKVMWAASLNMIEAQTPQFIKDLISKSPNLKYMPYSKTSLKKDGDSFKLSIENNAEGVKSTIYGDHAREEGEKAALDYINKELEKLEKSKK